MKERSETTTPSSGATLIADRYEVIEEIARPGAGRTLKARHTLLGSFVAVTVLPEEATRDAARLTRVQDAVRRACQLRHDHLLPVLDFGRDGDRYHVVEALVDAKPLSALLADGPLAPADALHLGRQLADALAHAHERGVVHGAISPASVLVEAGPRPRALLSGLAVADVLADATLLAWATPERFAGKELDARTDVFALGLVLYEMLEGEPFLAGTEAEIRRLLLEERNPLLPQFSCIAPAGVAGVVARAWRRTPSDRQQSMTQVREDVEACLRRLGQRSAAAASTTTRTPVVQSGVRRVVARVVDESVEELESEPAPEAVAPEPAAAPALAAERVRPGTAPAASPATRRAAFPRAVKVTAKGPRTTVAGMLLIGGVVVALGRPLLPERSVPPEAPEKVAATARRRPAPGGGLLPGPPLLAPSVPVPFVEVPQAIAPARVEVAAVAKVEPVVVEPFELERSYAPRVVSAAPRQREGLGVAEGGTLAFTLRAADRNAGDPLAYAWFVDGRPAGKGRAWRLVTKPGSAGTSHTVEAEVSDGTGLKAPRVSWRVRVTPRMSAANVREWLARLTAALEAKDLATLRLYGVVRSEADAVALKERFPLLGRYRVSIANEAIRTDGQYASVSFDLTELDWRGKARAPRRQSYELEKQVTGFVGVRGR